MPAIRFRAILNIFLITILCSCGGNTGNVQQESQLVEAEIPTSQTFSGTHIPLYDIARVVDGSSQQDSSQIEVFAYLKERPTDSAQLEATVRYISRIQAKKYNPERIKVWLFTSEVLALNDDLTSDWIAQYFKNRSYVDGPENSMVNNSKLAYTLKDTSVNYYIRGVAEVKSFLSKKGVDYCRLFAEMQAIFSKASKKSDDVFEIGSQQNSDYAEKLRVQMYNEIRKKNGISEAEWDNIWRYGNYACDEFL